MTRKVVPCSLPSVLYIPENVRGLSIIFCSLEKVQFGHCFFRGLILHFGFQLIVVFFQWSWVQNFIALWILVVDGTIGEALWVLRDAEGIILWLFHMTLMLTSQQILFFSFPSQNDFLVDSHSMNNPLHYLAPFLQNFCQASGSPILKMWINYCYFRIAPVLSLTELQLIYHSFWLTSPTYGDCNVNPFQQSVCGSS